MVAVTASLVWLEELVCFAVQGGRFVPLSLRASPPSALLAGRTVRDSLVAGDVAPSAWVGATAPSTRPSGCHQPGT
jgi:hypothetical protein